MHTLLTLVDESDLAAALRIGPAEPVEDVALLLAVEVSHGLLVQLVEHLRGRGLVHLAPVNVFVGRAPDVPDDPLVGRAPPRELARVDGEGVPELGRGDVALAVPDLVLEELLEGLVLVDGGGARDAQGGDAGGIAGGRAEVRGRGVVPPTDGILFDGEGGFARDLLVLRDAIRGVGCPWLILAVVSSSSSSSSGRRNGRRGRRSRRRA